MPHILQSSAKKTESTKYRDIWNKDFIEKFFHTVNILDLPATIQLAKIWRRQSTTEMLKQKENFERFGIK